MPNITRQSSNRRKEKGVAIVEMAVALPVFIMLLLGVVDYARAMWTYNTLEHAAREVGRYASVHSIDSGAPVTLDQLTTYAHNRCAGLAPDRLKVNASYQPSNTLGSKVTIDLIYNFSPVIPVLPDSLKRLVGSSQMRVTY